MRTYCNPLNLPYRMQPPGRSGARFREAADPSVVRYQGAYWLFPSKSGGYWRSEDLRDWAFVPSRILPTQDYAPEVRVIDGTLTFTASRRGTPSQIFRSTDPASDSWEKVSEPFAYWDPSLFQDDDGRVYLYWGCSDTRPLLGIEMDRTGLLPVGAPRALIAGQPGSHGWERGGESNTGGTPPWVEGAWMTKHAGRYYLQYAAPGTQWNVYADGVNVSSHPLGPFEYATHNPFSLKPGGFITGAGHGSTFGDVHGNFWHASTMRISVRHMFERRIGLFPAGFDGDGILFCNTSFGDYPTRLPTGRWSPWSDPFAGVDASVLSRKGHGLLSAPRPAGGQDRRLTRSVSQSGDGARDPPAPASSKPAPEAVPG